MTETENKRMCVTCHSCLVCAHCVRAAAFEQVLENIDALIEKVFKDIAEHERQLAQLNHARGDKRGKWISSRIRAATIYGMKSVQIDIEDMRKDTAGAASRPG